MRLEYEMNPMWKLEELKRLVKEGKVRRIIK